MLTLTVPQRVIVGTEGPQAISASLVSTRDRRLRTASFAIVALAPFDIIGMSLSHLPLQLIGGVAHPIKLVIGGKVESGTYRRRAMLRCDIGEGDILSNWADFVVRDT